MFKWFSVTLTSVLSLTGQELHADPLHRPEIKLVLQITVDGLRGDLLNRYANGLGKGGFKYLMQNGTVYTPMPTTSMLILKLSSATPH